MSNLLEPVLAIWAGLAGFISGLVMNKIGYFRRFQAILIAFVLNVVFVSVFSVVKYDGDSSYTTMWIVWSSILLISIMLIFAPRVRLRQIGAAQQSPQTDQVSLATGKDPWFYQIWWIALTNPGEANYLELLENQKPSWLKAYWWVFASGLSGGFLGVLATEEARSAISSDPTIGLIILLVVLILDILAVTGFAVESFISQMIVRLEGGQGNSTNLVYIQSAINAPIIGINSFLVAVGIAKVSSDASYWLAFLPFLICIALVYTTVLGIIAVKATNKFTILRSAIAVVPYRLFLIIIIIAASTYLRHNM